MRTISRLAATAALVWVATACSASAPISSAGPGGAAGGSGGPAGNPNQPVVTADSCALLTDEEITAGTGHDVLSRTPSTLTQVFPSVCDIELDGGVLTVSVKSSGGRAMYETSFEAFLGDDEDGGYLTEAVTGVGDKAGRSSQSDLMVLSGDVLFELQYLGSRSDKPAVLQYLAERIVAKLSCISTGCPPISVPPGPTEGAPGPGPTQPTVDPGALPSTGAQARVVNLFHENGAPVTVDVYAYAWSETEMREIGALVATVPYGEASAWFNPGLVQAPFSTEGYTKIDIFREGDQSDSLSGLSEFLGPGTVTTIAVWQEEVFEGQQGAWVGTIYAEHPTNPVSTPKAGSGALISRNFGLNAEEDPPFLYASVGEGCLESPIGRTDPDIPNAQPLSNDLVLPVGEWTLTVHDAPFGELPTCDKPLGPGAPVSVAAGDRLLAFPYRLPGESEINLLAMPFGP